MAYNPYAMSNPYLYPTYGNKTPDQLAQELQQMIANNPYAQPSAPNNPAMDNRGDYMEVKDPKVVETYPARIDGKATLFFDFEHWTFCSKKLINGKPSLQWFCFQPLNNSAEAVTNPDPQNTAEDTQMVQDESSDGNALSMILDKLEKTDKRLAKLSKEVAAVKKNQKAVTGDGI